jgi:outer membrane receptor protein involved in Fe transport
VLGVVNVITRSPSQLPGLNATVEAAGAGRRQLALTRGGDAGPARLLLGAATGRSRGRDLYFPAYDTPQTNGGWAVGQDGEHNETFYLKGRWSDLTLSVALSDRTHDDPTGSYGTVFNTLSWSTDRYALSDLSYSHAFGEAHELFARLGAARYRYRSYAIYDQAGLLVPAQSPSDADWTAGELRYVWSGWTGHRVLLGFEFQDNRRQAIRSEDLEPAPQVYQDLSLTSARYSLFANDDWRVAPSVRLNLGARADRRLDGHVSVTPRIAALWNPSARWTLKVQHGSAYREPNISETHYTDGTQQPNGALRVESLVSTEVSALWRPLRTLEGSVSLYDLRIHDLITLVTLPDGTQQYRNQGRVRSRGVQAELTWEPGSGVQWRASGSLQKANDADTGLVLSDAPRFLGKVSVTVPLAPAGTRLGANLQWVGARQTLTGATVAGYARVNLQLNHAPAGQPWSLGLGVVNLTNQRYADPGGPEHVQDTLPQDGREFVLRFGWAF